MQRKVRFLSALQPLWCVACDDVLRTCVVAECVQNSYEVVQAWPVVRVAVQTLLKSVTGKRDAHQPYSHLTNFIPQVHISGVQHDCLRIVEKQKKKVALTL